MTSAQDDMYVGELGKGKDRVRIEAFLRDGQLHLVRTPVDRQGYIDVPITLVTREGLLRLVKGPFEQGFIEDHL